MKQRYFSSSPTPESPARQPCYDYCFTWIVLECQHGHYIQSDQEVPVHSYNDHTLALLYTTSVGLLVFGPGLAMRPI